MIKYLPKIRATKFWKGETLLEVIIALFVIIIGSATATNLIITSLRANVYNRDNLIALNFAQEGIEMMRNVRDTNWLKFSGNTQECWNLQPNRDTCDPANPTQKLLSGYYNSNFDFSSDDFTLNNGIDDNDKKFNLKYFDNNTSVDSDNNGNNSDDKDFISSGTPAIGTEIGQTKFYRSIHLTYDTLDDNGLLENNGGTTVINAEIMLVTTHVAWLDSGMVREIKLNTALTRYK